MEREQDFEKDFVEKRCRRIAAAPGGLDMLLEDGSSASLAWEKVPQVWQDEDGALNVDLEDVVYVLPRGAEGYDALLKELPRRLGKRFSTGEELRLAAELLVALAAPLALFSAKTDRAKFARERPLVVLAWAGVAFGLLGWAVSWLWSPALLFLEAYAGSLTLATLLPAYALTPAPRALFAAAMIGLAGWWSRDAFRRLQSGVDRPALTLKAKQVGFDGGPSLPPFKFFFEGSSTPFVGGLDLYLDLKPGDRVKARAYYDGGRGYLLTARKV